MNTARDVKTDLTEYLRELHLPAIRQCFEEKARQAERETLSYEQYLLDLAERECQERHENRIARLLRESKLPLATFRRKILRLTCWESAQRTSDWCRNVLPCERLRLFRADRPPRD